MGLKNGDPGRIAAQVISGIGFLGAGAIIQMKGSVKGLRQPHFPMLSKRMHEHAEIRSVTLTNEVYN